MNSEVTSELVEKVTGLRCADFENAHGLGLVGGGSEYSYLGFIDDSKYIESIQKDGLLVAYFVSPELQKEIGKLRAVPIESDDPRFDYYTVHNYLAKAYLEENYYESIVDGGAEIHPDAWISACNVIIDKQVIIESNSSVNSFVEIGPKSTVGSSCSIGFEGFEFKRVRGGILGVIHDGIVLIGADVSIGPGSRIAKGFRNFPTKIGNSTKIDGNVYVAHGVLIGNRVLVAAGAVICGRVVIEDDCWIGPGSTISNGVTIGKGARVTLGASVFSDVPAGAVVAGNPARQIPAVFR